MILLNYYLTFLPIIFVQVAPVACLLATLYTFGTLNRGNEIIAMRASGLSIVQVTKVALMFGILVSMFLFWVNDRIVPQASALSAKIKSRMQNKSAEKYDESITNLSMYGLKNRLFFVNNFSPATNSMEGIVILEHDEKQNITKKIVASKGIYQDGVWKFYQCITYDFDANGQIINEQYLDEEIMTILESPREFLSQRQKPEYMTISQLEDYIWRLSKSGAQTVIRRLMVNFYERFAMPLESIMLILLGIPFSLMMKKRATGLSSIGIALILGFLYYVLNAVSLALGNAGIFPAFVAAFFAHAVALLTSAHLISQLP